MDQQPEKNGHRQEIITVLVILVIAVVVVAAVAMANKKPDASDTAAVSQEGSSQQSSSPSGKASDSGSYKDGAYTATGSYDSPGGTEKITISVTLKDGTVTDTSAKGGAVDAEGEEYQSQFIAAYKDQVIGKNINNISLSRVSGSSLTSQGFNNALSQIKQEAAS